jgi:hypothetical protein
MHSFARSALVALALGAVALPAAAQDVAPTSDGPPRQGFYIGLGLATASVSADCSTCADDVDAASMFGSHLKLGGTLSKSVRLGADLFGVTTSEGLFDELAGGGGADVTETAGHLMAAVTVYPSAAGNFWFQAGLGSVVFLADVDGDQKYTARGFGGMLGVGYDFRLGRNGSLTPYLSLTSSTNGKVYDEDGNEVGGGDEWQTAFFAFGVDYVFH